MDIFLRLSRVGDAIKERAQPVWRRQLSSCAAAICNGSNANAQTGCASRRRLRAAVSAGPFGLQLWRAYKSDQGSFTPFFTPVAALLVGLAAFGQWRTARVRHEEQTEADRRRRISESYSKAVTQLASDKIEERLGGIYTLESISKESPDDYWTVMETLCAFVRNRSRWMRRLLSAPISFGSTPVSPMGETRTFWHEAVERNKRSEPPTDIAAILWIIMRRAPSSRDQECQQRWRLNLRGTDLRGAGILWLLGCLRACGSGAHLEKVDFRGANLEDAKLAWARLDDAGSLWSSPSGGATLFRATFAAAHLEGADLRGATGLSTGQLALAYGDAMNAAAVEHCAAMAAAEAPKWPGRQQNSWRPSCIAYVEIFCGAPVHNKPTVLVPTKRLRSGLSTFKEWVLPLRLSDGQPVSL